MATGLVSLTTQSVDYGGGRGAYVLVNNIEYTISGNSISFRELSSSDNVGGAWRICGAQPYYLILQPEVSYDNGASWTPLDTKTMTIGSCDSTATMTNVVNASHTLIGQLGSYTLNRNCQLRFLYATNSAPAPTSSLPHAFPNTGYSAATQVPVVINVDYRPGQRKVSGTWRSLNREGGQCRRKVNGSWVTMTTSDGGVGTGNPPLRKSSGTWYNQRKIGAE